MNRSTYYQLPSTLKKSKPIMIRNSICFLLLCFCSSTFAQHTYLDVQNVERIVMPAVDNAALQAKEAERRKRKEVPEFATKFSVQINPSTHGTWESLPNGKALWRLRIYSKDAYSLNLGFRKYFMPKSGKMYLYNIDKSDIKGPFSADDNEVHGEFWSPLVKGDELIVEVEIDAREKSFMDLELGDINHDYAGHLLLQNCHLDVVCGLAEGFEEVENYRDIIQSVAMYSFNGVRMCTGFLVNNTRQDCTPYFMTAQHCGIVSGNAASMVVYWNFENSTCREISTPQNGLRGDGPLDDFNSGASLLAEFSNSDMALVKLDDAVSSSANAYFAGWNRSRDLPTSSICVHHPDTEEKRITLDFDPAFVGTWQDDDLEVPDGNHLIVDDWDLGSTEGGSSGAPLFDQDGFVIGQLHGGLASCNNDDYDAYGWFHTSWEGGGAANTRLKDWLDPDGLGIERLEGKWSTACTIALVPEVYVTDVCEQEAAQFEFAVGTDFTGMLRLEVAGLPASVNAEFSKNPVEAGDNVTLTLSNLSEIAGQTTIIDVISEGLNERAVTLLKLRVFQNGANTATVQLLAPENNNPSIGTMPTFSWAAGIEGTRYDFQLATDADFTQIVTESIGLSESAFISPNLESDRQYYWRVRSYTPCGGTDWSEVFSFVTAVCSMERAQDLPLDISPDAPNDYYSEVIITKDGRISDVNLIGIEGAHTWISDLQMFLISPAGTEVTLMDKICFNEQDFHFSFDDDSDLANLPCPPTDANTYRPKEALSAFIGENARGTWRLRIRDNESADGGTLFAWNLQICVADENSDIGVSLSQNAIEVCDEDEIQLSVSYNEGFGEAVEISATGLPAGATTNFEQVAGTNSTNVTIRGLNGIAEGQYDLTFRVSDGTVENFATLLLSVMHTPALPNLLEPANASMEIEVLPMLRWQPQENVNYLLEIALDENFTNIIESASTDAALYTIANELEGETTYYWRVTASNSCGMTTSATFSFITIAVTRVDEWRGGAVEVFPNPSSGKLHIDLKAVQTSVFAEVITLDAKVLQQRLLAPNQIHDIDLRSVASGIYVLRFTNEHGVLSKRIFIK